MTSKNQSFRIAIVGCGKIASKHAQAVVDTDCVELTALVDQSTARAADLAKRFQIEPTISTNVEEVVDSIDGAIIATPNHLHRDLAITCLQAGVPVLIEKPIAVSVEEGEEICRASEKYNVIAAVGYMTRFQENVRLMHSLLQSNYFGAVRRFIYQFGGRGGWSPLSAYNLDRSATGGGVLVATGSHFLDRLLYWFGTPSEVELQDDSTGGPDANAHAKFQYDREGNRFSGIALFSKTVSLPGRFVMETEQGKVSLDDNANAKIRYYPNSNTNVALTIENRSLNSTAPQPSTTNPFQLQIENFVNACRFSRAPAVSAREGLQSVQLIETLYANRSPMQTDWYPCLTEKAR